MRFLRFLKEKFRRFLISRLIKSYEKELFSSFRHKLMTVYELLTEDCVHYADEVERISCDYAKKVNTTVDLLRATQEIDEKWFE